MDQAFDSYHLLDDFTLGPASGFSPGAPSAVTARPTLGMTHSGEAGGSRLDGGMGDLAGHGQSLPDWSSDKGNRHFFAGAAHDDPLDPTVLEALLAGINTTTSEESHGAPLHSSVPQSQLHHSSVQSTSQHAPRPSISRKRTLDGPECVGKNSAAPSLVTSPLNLNFPTTFPTEEKDISPEALQNALASLPPATQQSLLAALISSATSSQNQRQQQPPSHSHSAPMSTTQSQHSSPMLHPQHHQPSQQHQPHLQQFQPAIPSPSTAGGFGLAQNGNQARFAHGTASGWWSHSQPGSPSIFGGHNAGHGYGHMREPQNGGMTPSLSPTAMTPLSVFSNSNSNAYSTDLTSLQSASGYPNLSQQPQKTNDFFSPLTSPALRPQGWQGQNVATQADLQAQQQQQQQHNVNLALLQPLIDQAAALGLSSPFPFQTLGNNSSVASQNLAQHLQQQQLQPEQQYQLVHQFALAQAQKAYAQASGSGASVIYGNGSTMPSNPLAQPQLSPQAFTALGNPPSVPTTKPRGAGGRSSRSSNKTRPSPLIRPTDAGSNSRKNRNILPAPGSSKDREEPVGEEDGGGSSKRARSVASGGSGLSTGGSPFDGRRSIQGTPALAGVAEAGKDTPSPVDLAGEMQVDPPATGGALHTLNPQELMPPPALPASLKSRGCHLSPVTPASIMNLGGFANSSSGNVPDLSPRARTTGTSGGVGPFDVEMSLPPPAVATSGSDVGVGAKVQRINGADDAVEEDGKTSGGSIPGESSAGVASGSSSSGRVGSSSGVNTFTVGGKAGGARGLRALAAKGGVITSSMAGSEALARIAAKPHYLDGRGKDFVSTATKAAMLESETAPDMRKSSHKVAEQKRRDALRLCLEDMRRILPPIHWSEEEGAEKRPGEGNVGGQRGNAFDPTNPNKGISKVALLRRSNEYMLTLHERIKRRDGAIELLTDALAKLQPLLPPDVAESSGATADVGVVAEVLAMIEQEKVEDAEARRKASEQFQNGEVDSDEEEGNTTKAKKKKAAVGSKANGKSGSVTAVAGGEEVAKPTRARKRGLSVAESGGS